jgi:hypothetical protein
VIAVGEFPAVIYDDLAAELRDRTVWRLEPNDVVGVRLVSGAERMELRREGDNWVNAENPQEQADTEKVRTFLGDLKDLSAERFLTYKGAPGDANKLGLAQPWATLEVRLVGGKTLSLAVSARGLDLTANRYASGGTVEGVFVLPSDIVGKLAKRFSDMQKAPPSPGGYNTGGRLPPMD